MKMDAFSDFHGYWHDTVAYLSVRLFVCRWRSVLWL